MRSPSILLLTALMLALTACGGGAVDASGEIVSQARDVTTFERIEAFGLLDIRVVVDPIAAPTVTVHYDDNVVDQVVTEVSGGTLMVRLDDAVTFPPGGNRRVEVVLPALTYLEAAGGAGISATGRVDQVELVARDGARLSLSGLRARRADIDASDATVSLTSVRTVLGSLSGEARLVVDPDALVDVGTSDDATIVTS